MRFAYGGGVCANCGRICDQLPLDDRCTDCGPLPNTPEEQAEYDEDAERNRQRHDDQWGPR
jgi:hypothetical protein